MNHPRLGQLLCALCLLCGFISTATAQSLRFFGRPTEPFEGDAVTFTYRTDLAGIVPLSQIRSWKWDFNGDDLWDETKTVGETDASGRVTSAADINTTWYATLDSRPLVDGRQAVTPKLEVTYDPGTGPVILTQTGVTENTIGPTGVAPDPDTQLFVKDRSVGNADVSVNFTVNPRLAKAAQPAPNPAPAETVRLYSSVKPADGRTLVSASYAWTITPTGGGAPITSSLANPQLNGLAAGSYDVSLTSN